jgi:hypothetical protein
VKVVEIQTFYAKITFGYTLAGQYFMLHNQLINKLQASKKGQNDFSANICHIKTLIN